MQKKVKKVSNVIEALLFAVGDDGLSIDELSNILEIDEEKVKNELSILEKEYENRGIEIKILGNKYKLVTKEIAHDYLVKLSDTVSNTLSKSA